MAITVERTIKIEGSKSKKVEKIAEEITKEIIKKEVFDSPISSKIKISPVFSETSNSSQLSKIMAEAEEKIKGKTSTFIEYAKYLDLYKRSPLIESNSVEYSIRDIVQEVLQTVNNRIYDTLLEYQIFDIELWEYGEITEKIKEKIVNQYFWDFGKRVFYNDEELIYKYATVNLVNLQSLHLFEKKCYCRECLKDRNVYDFTEKLLGYKIEGELEGGEPLYVEATSVSLSMAIANEINKINFLNGELRPVEYYKDFFRKLSYKKVLLLISDTMYYIVNFVKQFIDDAEINISRMMYESELEIKDDILEKEKEKAKEKELSAKKEMQNLKAKLKEQSKKKAEDTSTETKTLKKQIKDLNSKNYELEKQNKELLKKVEELEYKLKPEVRNGIYYAECFDIPMTPYEDSEIISENINKTLEEEVSQKRLCFIMMNDWADKENEIKKAFPNSKITDKHKTISKETELVVFLTDKIAHRVFNGVMSECGKKNIPYMSTASVNVDRIKSDIVEYYKNKEEDK